MILTLERKRKILRMILRILDRAFVSFGVDGGIAVIVMLLAGVVDKIFFGGRYVLTPDVWMCLGLVTGIPFVVISLWCTRDVEYLLPELLVLC